MKTIQAKHEGKNGRVTIYYFPSVCDSLFVSFKKNSLQSAQCFLELHVIVVINGRAFLFLCFRLCQYDMAKMCANFLKIVMNELVSIPMMVW